jgi:7,8-dihydroneopterin aldolase/epimerase/oxygenase
VNSFIIISELEVFYRVGVPEAERARPQRLLLNLEIAYDFSQATAADDINATIDYHSVCQRLLSFGEGREWKLIETLADDIARMILEDFKAGRVQIEVRKFIVPQTRYVAVKLLRSN